MDDFTITDGSTSTTVSDGSTVTIEGSGLVSVANSGGTFTVSTTANNYVHPTQSAINASGSGATVVDGVTVNTLGHTTAVSTRALTLSTLVTQVLLMQTTTFYLQRILRLSVVLNLLLKLRLRQVALLA